MIWNLIHLKNITLSNIFTIYVKLFYTSIDIVVIFNTAIFVRCRSLIRLISCFCQVKVIVHIHIVSVIVNRNSWVWCKFWTIIILECYTRVFKRIFISSFIWHKTWNAPILNLSYMFVQFLIYYWLLGILTVTLRHTFIFTKICI